MSRTKLDEGQFRNTALVSERELQAGWLNSPVRQNLTINTFSSGTGQVSFTTTLLDGSNLEVRQGQYLSVVSGGAIGTYLILSLVNDTTLSVQGLSATGSGGTANIFEPPASENLGVSTEGFTLLTGHSKLQDLLAQLDLVLAGLSAVAAIGIGVEALSPFTIAPPLMYAFEVGADPADQIGLDTFP